MAEETPVETDEQLPSSKPWQFKPGQSGNPAGRPKGVGLTDELKRLFKENDGQLRKELMSATIKNAAEGNGLALKIIFDRIEGPVTNKLEISDPLSVNVNLFARAMAESNVPPDLAKATLSRVALLLGEVATGGVAGDSEEEEPS